MSENVDLCSPQSDQVVPLSPSFSPLPLPLPSPTPSELDLLHVPETPSDLEVLRVSETPPAIAALEELRDIVRRELNGEEFTPLPPPIPLPPHQLENVSIFILLCLIIYYILLF